jgi:hypothetical protein
MRQGFEARHCGKVLTNVIPKEYAFIKVIGSVLDISHNPLKLLLN